MTMYSDGNVKTEILDPVAHRGFWRSVFHLDSRHGAYLTNLRLTNLGFFGTNTPDPKPLFKAGRLDIVRLN